MPWTGGSPPPGPGGAGGGGGGSPGPGGPDPYASGRWTNVLMPGQKRMGWEVYWRLRTGADGARSWLTSYYPGKKNNQYWLDLWTVATSIDVCLEKAHQQGGYPAVCHALQSDDMLEIYLTRIASEMDWQQHGEQATMRDLQAGKAPGLSSLAPDWANENARANAREIARQDARVRNQPLRGQDDDDEDPVPGRRRRRRNNGNGAAAAPTAKGGGRG